MYSDDYYSVLARLVIDKKFRKEASKEQDKGLAELAEFFKRKGYVLSDDEVAEINKTTLKDLENTQLKNITFNYPNKVKPVDVT